MNTFLVSYDIHLCCKGLEVKSKQNQTTITKSKPKGVKDNRL